MEWISKTLLFLHISAGFASLILFWIPIFTRKGGKNHRYIGKIYIKLMWIVVGTAAVLSIENLMTGNVILGAFLGFISLITANPLWYGMAILNQKKEISNAYRKGHLILHILIVLTGIALISYGIYLKGEGAAILMFIFGGLGLTDIMTVYKSIKTPQQKAHWFKDHLVGMCTSGIAAYTAFLVFGANRFLENLLSGYWSIIPWVLPTVIGTFGIRYAVKNYQKKGMITE